MEPSGQARSPGNEEDSHGNLPMKSASGATLSLRSEVLGSLKSGSAKLRQKLSSSEICLEKDLHKLMETHETIYSFFFRLFLFQKSKEAQKFILPVSLYFVVSDQVQLKS